MWILVLSALGQGFAPRATAEASAWGVAPGWQREIAFFDLAMALLAILALRSRDIRFQRGVTFALVILTALVGTNHLVTVLSGKSGLVHEVFSVVNYVLVLFGLAALMRWKTSPTTDPAEY